MRYSLLVVPFCTLSVFAQPIDDPTADAQLMAITNVTLRELLRNAQFGDMGLMAAGQPSERDVAAAQDDSDNEDDPLGGHGPENEVKIKWHADGQSCKTDCKHSRCVTEGGLWCRTQRPYDVYPPKGKFKAKWPGPNGEECKEKCKKRKCEIQGGEACKKHDFSKLMDGELKAKEEIRQHQQDGDDSDSD